MKIGDLWPSFNVGQTNVEKMHFCRLSRYWVLKVDIGTHLRDKHGHLFLTELDLIWPSLKVSQTKVESTFVNSFRIEFLKWI